MRNGLLGQIAEPPPGTLLSAAIAHMQAADWDAAHRTLLDALTQADQMRDARLLLSEVCQARGDADAGLTYLTEALAHQPLTHRPLSHQTAAQRPVAARSGPARRLLMLAVPGDFQANLPLAMLLDDDRTELFTLWITDPAMILADPCRARRLVPCDIDLVFNAIAQDERHDDALRAADKLIAALNRPSINSPRIVSTLSRCAAARLMQGCADLVAPQPRHVSRKMLASLSDTNPTGTTFLVRPEHAHAGRGLTHATSRADREAYLARHPHETGFIITPFVDTRSADGLWRKYRAIFVDGRWLPLHLAIHTDWAVWYYNAQMHSYPERRAEEAAFLATPTETLPLAAQRALEHIARRVRLDYFGVDFGVLSDGRLALFEIETGMIVHDRDDPEIFGYRKAAVQRIRDATEQMLDRRIDRRIVRERNPYSRKDDNSLPHVATAQAPRVRSNASGDPLVGAHLHA